MDYKSAGFTLIELLIVVTLIGILIAILIPNLLSARSKAIATGAQSYIRLCSNSMANYALDNFSTSLAGASCSDSSIQNTDIPSYIISSTVKRDILGQEYILYAYRINGQAVSASLSLDLQ